MLNSKVIFESMTGQDETGQIDMNGLTEKCYIIKSNPEIVFQKYALSLSNLNKYDIIQSLCHLGIWHKCANYECCIDWSDLLENRRMIYVVHFDSAIFDRFTLSWLGFIVRKVSGPTEINERKVVNPFIPGNLLDRYCLDLSHFKI